jgi:surface antigen
MMIHGDGRQLRYRNAAVVILVLTCMELAFAAATEASSLADLGEAAGVPAPIYLGYAGRRWARDYGVLNGYCDRQAVGTIVDEEKSGAASSSRQPQREGHAVATVVGRILGGPAEALLGRDLGDKDRACLGQALELAGAEKSVAWSDHDRGIAYRMIPLGGFPDGGKSCREFVTRIVNKEDRSETVRHKACSSGNGVWQVIG